MTKQELLDLKYIDERHYVETSGTYATFKCKFTYDVCFGNLYITYYKYVNFWLNPIAIACNSTTNFEIQLYDYRHYIELQCAANLSYKQLLEDIRDYPQICANCLFLKNMTTEEAQKIINDNILAFHKLNDYVAEQKLIEQIEAI